MSKSPRTTHDDFDAIERYVATTFARFQRVVVDLVPTLVEPRTSDPARALKRLAFLVETLSGFAIGAAVGAVASAARRSFGEPVRGAVGRQLGRILRAGAPAALVVTELAALRFLPDRKRPLLDALGSQLHARLCRTLPETRSHLAFLHAEITRQAPDQLPAFTAMLDKLAADDASAIAFADQLAAGWHHYAIAVSERPVAGLAEAPLARETWQKWTGRLAGRAAVAEATAEQVVAEGFLMRIG